MSTCNTCKGSWELPHKEHSALSLPRFLCFFNHWYYQNCISLLLLSVPQERKSVLIFPLIHRGIVKQWGKSWVHLKNEDKFLFWWCCEMFCSWLHLPLNLHSFYSVRRMELQFTTTFICFSSNSLRFTHHRKRFDCSVRIHVIAFWHEIHFLAWMKNT